MYVYVRQRLQDLRQRAADQASFIVQTAGVYQSSHRALILGVSRGTSGATVTRTVLTTATKRAAKVCSQALLLVIIITKVIIMNNLYGAVYIVEDREAMTAVIRLTGVL